MNVLDRVKDKLQKYPHVRYEATKNSIKVLPLSEAGFEVSLCVAEHDSVEPFAVYYNGWHEEFSSEDEALECFALGLSSECRLKEASRGGEVYKWTMEFRRDGEWHHGGTTALVFVRFWSRKSERFLQNNLVIADPS